MINYQKIIILTVLVNCFKNGSNDQMNHVIFFVLNLIGYLKGFFSLVGFVYPQIRLPPCLLLELIALPKSIKVSSAHFDLFLY